MGYTVLLHAALETAKICLPTVIEARRGVLRQQDCDTRLRSWAERVLLHVQAELEISGLEHVSEREGPYVVVSNHQSHYDIPTLYALLPLSLRMAAKKELFRTPLWGQALRDSGFVEINRSSPEEAHRALEVAGHRMRQSKISLYVAPEGTRSADGTLGRFKSGAFRMASVMQLPILPVAISGTHAIHRKGSREVTKGCKIEGRVLPPVQPGQFATVEEAATEVRELIRRALED